MQRYSGIVQSVEQRTVNPYVVGSSPTARAKISRLSGIFLYFYGGNLFLYKTHQNIKNGHFYPRFFIKIHQKTQNAYETPPLHFYKYVFLSDGFFYDLYIDFYIDFYVDFY